MFTLHVEHAVLLGIFTILTLINTHLHDGAEGGYWFPAYTGCAFTGAVLIALRGHGLGETSAIVSGVVFFHLGYFCLHAALDAVLLGSVRLNRGLIAQIAGMIAAIAGLIQYTVVTPDTGRRIVFYSAIFAFQNSVIAAGILRKSQGWLVRPGRVMATLLACLALNNLIRAGLTLHQGAPANYLDAGLGLQLNLLAITVLQVAIMIGFVWITAAVLHERLDHLASTDSLTGLLNRRALEAAAEHAIALSREHRRPLTAVLVDLDQFKQINDAFGHAFGDYTLREVARCMKQQMRHSDLLARVGGDEFAVLLHDTSREEAMEIAERLRVSLEELVVLDGPSETRVHASFGLAEVDQATLTWPDLVTRCDEAVYRAKGIGGNLAAAH